MDTAIIPDAAILDLGRTVEVNLSTFEHEKITMAFFYILNALAKLQANHIRVAAKPQQSIARLSASAFVRRAARDPSQRVLKSAVA